MKPAYVSLIIAACAASSLQAFAASQAGSMTSTEMPTLPAAEQSIQVRTADSGWAVPAPVSLDRQTVQSQGGSLRPGPHNRQLTKPHGGPVLSVARSDEVPGRE
jgi:hypothetical protein